MIARARTGRRRRAAAALGAVAAVGVLLAGCTGVPGSSVPQVIENGVGGNPASASISVTPQPGADPRTIVATFLDAAETDDPHHTAARGFLSPEAQSRWTDTTITIVDQFEVGNFTAGNVAVSGREIGSVSASGVYTPELQGDGSGGGSAGSPPVTFSTDYGVSKVNGQWRIDTLQNGVVVTAAAFARLYIQRQLYFYDLDEQHVVPDPRYSALADPGLLATWLMTQLVAGPRPELQNAVTTEFPAQSDPKSVTVALGSPAAVTVPGAGRLDPQTRNRVAAQIALTLGQVPTTGQFALTDGGREVSIPAVDGTKFAAADFQGAVSPAVVAPSVFYVRDGGVVDQSGRALPGRVGSSTYGLQSVALASSGSPDLRVAGVAGTGANAQLVVGTVGTGLHPTTVRGALSRPAWAPERDEVWVGQGRSIMRAGLSGTPSVVPLTLASGSVIGTVAALRFSPEGSRIALVISAADGTSQVWLGSVVRNQSQVRVDNLEPITPQGVAVTDVAWNDPLKLFVIGRSLATGDANVYEVQVDGSLWSPRNITNLPRNPDSITVAEDQDAWVSAGPTVWVQRAGAWASPGTGEVPGVNPVYLE